MSDIEEARPPVGDQTTNGNENDNNTNSRRSNNNNNRNNYRSRPPTNKYKGEIDTITTLSTKAEISGQDFSTCTKSLHQHVIKNFNNPVDIAPAVKDFVDPMKILNQKFPSKLKIRDELGLTETAAASDETDAKRTTREAINADVRDTMNGLWMAEMSEFAKRNNIAKSNLAALWGVIMEQCTPSLTEQIRAEEDYETHATSYNRILILNTLQKVTSEINNTSNAYYSLYHAMKYFYRIRQNKEESVESYFHRFETAYVLISLSKGSILDITSLLAYEYKTDSTFTKAAVLQRFLVIAFIESVCVVRYIGLWKELKNELAKKNDNYPVTVAEAVALLTNWKDPNQRRPPLRDNQLSLMQGRGRSGRSGRGGRGRGQQNIGQNRGQQCIGKISMARTESSTKELLAIFVEQQGITPPNVLT